MKQIKMTSFFLLFSFATAINSFAQMANPEEKFGRNNDISTVSDDNVANLGTEHIQSGSREGTSTTYHAGMGIEDDSSVVPAKKNHLVVSVLAVAYVWSIRYRLHQKRREIKVES